MSDRLPKGYKACDRCGHPKHYKDFPHARAYQPAPKICKECENAAAEAIRSSDMPDMQFGKISEDFDPRRKANAHQLVLRAVELLAEHRKGAGVQIFEIVAMTGRQTNIVTEAVRVLRQNGFLLVATDGGVVNSGGEAGVGGSVSRRKLTQEEVARLKEGLPSTEGRPPKLPSFYQR